MFSASLMAQSLFLLTAACAVEVEAAADALLPARVVDHREVCDAELPVEVSSAEDAHDVRELVLVNVPLGEGDVRRPLVRVVVVGDGAGHALADDVPDLMLLVQERRAAVAGE